MRKGMIALSLAAAVMLIAALPAFAGRRASSIVLVMPTRPLAGGTASPPYGEHRSGN